jgi:hypothetical protein
MYRLRLQGKNQLNKKLECSRWLAGIPVIWGSEGKGKEIHALLRQKLPFLFMLFGWSSV